ncbi:MAG: hypothetical protein JNM09_26860, partial [Blastocatellia bacterium]|nr:hypothetical protein [Blastocatellia bacterium]
MKRVRFQHNAIRSAMIVLLGFGALSLLVNSGAAGYQGTPPALRWIEAGAGGILPAESYY